MSVELIKNIAKIVKFHRKRAGLTQIQLAELAGMGKATIWEIEHGKKTFQFDTLYNVLQALNIRIRFTSPLMKEFERTMK